MVMTDSLAMVEGGEFVPVVAVLIANESINDVQASLSALHGQSYGALRVLIAADRHMIGEIEALVAQASIIMTSSPKSGQQRSLTWLSRPLGSSVETTAFFG